MPRTRLVSPKVARLMGRRAGPHSNGPGLCGWAPGGVASSPAEDLWPQEVGEEVDAEAEVYERAAVSRRCVRPGGAWRAVGRGGVAAVQRRMLGCSVGWIGGSSWRLRWTITPIVGRPSVSSGAFCRRWIWACILWSWSLVGMCVLGVDDPDGALCVVGEDQVEVEPDAGGLPAFGDQVQLLVLGREVVGEGCEDALPGDAGGGFAGGAGGVLGVALAVDRLQRELFVLGLDGCCDRVRQLGL